jgi:DNA-binding NtrC family response regulator
MPFPVTTSSSLSVLIVDDEPGIRQLVQHWLTRDGHSVACASDGAEARRLLDTQTFDLIITDIVMPGGDGFELIPQFRKLQPGARILAISGGGKYLQSAECLKIARSLGAHAIVMKPFSWEQFRGGIETAVPNYSGAAP